MKDPESRTVFAGVDGRTGTELPDWYRRKKTVDEARSFAEAVRDLPQAVETTVAYQNPYTDEWVETERFNALVEPTRARDHATDDEPNVDPLFHVPTDSYAIIDPVDVYRPLEEILREETIDGTPLGNVMFGEVRRYRGGGEVHMDVMFDGLEVRLPSRADPITTHIATAYEFEVVQPEMVNDECHHRVVVVTDEREVVVLGDSLKRVHVRTQRSGPGFQMFDTANSTPLLPGRIEIDRVNAEFPTGIRERVGVRVPVERLAEVALRIEFVLVECVVQRRAVDRGRSSGSLQDDAIHIEQHRRRVTVDGVARRPAAIGRHRTSPRVYAETNSLTRTIVRIASSIAETVRQAKESIASNNLTPIPPAPTNPRIVAARTLMSHR